MLLDVIPDCSVCVFSGQVGDWKNWFTAAENEEFDRRHRERMQRCGDLTVDFEP